VRLFDKIDDFGSVEGDCAKAAGWAHSSDSRHFSMSAMKSQRRSDIHIANTIAICHRKRLIVTDMISDATDPPSSLGVFSGVNQRHAPRLSCVAQDLHRVCADVESHVRSMQEVIREKFLDVVSAIPEADHEVVQSVSRIDFHDVPQDRAAADLDHWLGPDRRLLREARAKPACQNDNLHPRLPKDHAN